MTKAQARFKGADSPEPSLFAQMTPKICRLGPTLPWLGGGYLFPCSPIIIWFVPLVSLYICAGIVIGKCHYYQDLLCLQRRLWGVCNFAKACLSLRNSTKISCAGSDGDLCTVYVNSECCGESAPATTAHLCNHQCVVSRRQKMLPVRCNKIPQ